VGQEAATSLNAKILAKLRDNNGTLPVSDKSDPALISSLFGVSKGNFKKAIGALYKNGQIVIHADRIELS
jgi:predicted RNA-binding protein (virulence factor B family)